MSVILRVFAYMKLAFLTSMSVILSLKNNDPHKHEWFLTSTPAFCPLEIEGLVCLMRCCCGCCCCSCIDARVAPLAPPHPPLAPPTPRLAHRPSHPPFSHPHALPSTLKRITLPAAHVECTKTPYGNFICVETCRLDPGKPLAIFPNTPTNTPRNGPSPARPPSIPPGDPPPQKTP